MPRLDSLALRLTVFAAAASFVGLLVAGAVLQSLYARSAERTFDARLQVYLALLVANAVTDENQLVPPGTLGDPRFELPLSGWYWQIRPFDRERGGTLTSPSLFDVALRFVTDTTVDEFGYRRGYAEGPGESRLRMIERQIRLGANGPVYVFSIGADDAELRVDIADFRRDLALTLAVFAVCLVIVFFIQVRFGLLPLKRLGRELWRVRLGEAERLGGTYPREVQAVVTELNALIRSNAEIVERARTHVGNLAHALKTPLSVVLNEARTVKTAAGSKIAEQADLMSERITHALERARMAARVGVIGAVTEVAPAVDAIARTMGRLHRERGLVVETSVEQGLRFRGERQDLEEIVGNLVDNACKWARGRVHVAATRATAPATSGEMTGMMELVIEDDGQGLAEGERERALQRGQRLDETRPGSGLGLAIVQELVALYGGSLSLERAFEGGLRAVVRLPAI